MSGRSKRTSAGTSLAVAVLLGGVGLVAPADAQASDALVRFRIPAQSLSEALVAFGLQAGVSVGGEDLSRCGPQSSPVVARLTPPQALTRLLAGTRCTFRVVDARAYSVVVGLDRPEEGAADPRSPAGPVVADVPPVMLLDLMVTTTRRPSLVSRTPASVSLASANHLSVSRLDSLQELAPEFAGVTVTNLGPGRNKIFIRGLSDGAFTGRTQSTVGLYLDDVPITYNAPDPDLRLVDFERVELMRGPQGTLYGVGSMGGVVRLVTAKPDLEAFAAGAAVSGAVTESAEPSYAFDAMVNVPIRPDKLAVRAVVYRDMDGGYIDDAPLKIKNANRTTRTGGRIAVAAALAPDWRMSGGLNYQNLHSEDSQYAEGGQPGFQRDILTREPHHNDFTQAYATLQGSSALGDLKVSASYLVHAFKTRYDASTGLPVFVSTSPFRLLDQKDKVRLAVAEATFISAPGPRLQWLAGLFASRTVDDLNLDLGAMQIVTRDTLYFEERKDRLSELAIYGEASYALAPTVVLTAGARAFHALLSTRSFRDQAGATARFSGTRSASDISPKLVLSWQPSPTRLIYAQAAQGYRTGGFNTTGRITQQFNAGATGNQPNRRYRPDTVWSYELGAKVSLFRERVQLRSAVFYNDWRDVQSDQFLPSGLPYTANVGRAVNTGFEGEATFRPLRTLELRMSFLANTPELRQRDATYPARPNASLPAVPRYSAAAAAQWRGRLTGDVHAVVTARVAYVGSSILTFQEQQSSNMGNYVAARLTAGVETAGWRLSTYIDNPTGAQGDTFAFGDPFTQGRVRQFTPLRPRTVGLSLSKGL